jgi:hypothetical protein
MHGDSQQSTFAFVIIAAVVAATLTMLAGDAWRHVDLASELGDVPWDLVLRAIVYSAGGVLVLIGGSTLLDRFSQDHEDGETVALLAVALAIVAGGVAVAIGPEF